MVEYREISSLCQALGYSARTLYSVSNAIEKHYHEAELIKSNGEIRLIRVPNKLLKSIQRRIVDVILLQEPISDYAMAYIELAVVQAKMQVFMSAKERF